MGLRSSSSSRLIHAGSSRRERLLAFGISGAGKSTIWLAIAEWIHKTGSNAKVYVIDTDNAWEAMRPEDGHLDEVVVPFGIHKWGDYKPAVKKIREAGANAGHMDNWFVLDRADVIWDAAQEGWSQAVEGEDIDEFFLRHQVNQTAAGGDYGSNWVQIKRMYRGAGIDMITSFPGHVLACASSDEVREKKGQFGDDADVVAKYKHIGQKPSGQSKLAHLFHTELYLVESPSGYRMTTAKERKPFTDQGREYMKGKLVTPDFVVAYLVGVAGWKP